MTVNRQYFQERAAGAKSASPGTGMTPESRQPNVTTVDKSERRVRQMFGEIASRYDFLNHLLSGGTDFYWRWRTVRRVPPAGDAPILDVCTGTGDLARAYAKAGRGRVPVIGTDFTHEMLRLANSKVPADGPPITYVEADTQQLPFANDTFQIVSVAFGLRNVTNTELGLREMVRVCRPGGRIAVLAWTPESAFGAMGPLAGPFLPGPGGGAPVHRWARPDAVREVFAGLPVALESAVRTVDVVWSDLDQAMSEITGGNPAWIGIRAAVEPTGRWPELRARLRELLAGHGRADARFTLPVDYLETVATRG